MGDYIQWCDRVVKVVKVERAKPATRHTRGGVHLTIIGSAVALRRCHYYDNEVVTRVMDGEWDWEAEADQLLAQLAGSLRHLLEHKCADGTDDAQATLTAYEGYVDRRAGVTRD